MQAFDDALNHLFQIGLALAQIGVFHFIELARQPLELVGKRPAGVVQALGNPVAHAVENAFVLQQHHMHVEQGGQLAGRVFGQGGKHELHFLHHGIARLQHAVDFGFYRIRLDEVMLYRRAAGGQHFRPAHGHAAPYANAVYALHSAFGSSRCSNRC